MLWRALKDVENGFYIDVGANDPIVESVTKAFYERGWRGINIEPLSSHCHDLMRDRPDDINLQCAAGEFRSEIELWEADVRGWATASQHVIEKHQGDGHQGIFHKVPVLTLAEICTTYASSRDIHFLKIDVEGFEKSVIAGMDFSSFRPWIIVIEATEPNSTAENYQEWETDILSSRYLFSYADGLNRFYVAQERSDLLQSLKYPPNVFDDFIRSAHLNSELRAQQAEAKVQQAEENVQQAEIMAQNAQVALMAVHDSASWKLTAPFRKAVNVIRNLCRSSGRNE